MTSNNQWADVFPEIRYSKTDDPRIFQTPWIKAEGGKKKTFFACTTNIDSEGNNCYGIDVIKPWGKEDPGAVKSAMMRMKRAVYYYEKEGTWPLSDKSD